MIFGGMLGHSLTEEPVELVYQILPFAIHVILHQDDVMSVPF